MSQILQPGTSFATSAPATLDPSGAIVHDRALGSGLAAVAHAPSIPEGKTACDDSLFERFAWLYAFFRENLFRDDTHRIIDSLWPTGNPPASTRLLELGCGPGFYSCELAARFPGMSILGVDRSLRQLECAQKKARSLNLANCSFETDDVLDLSHADETFDALVAARLFTVIPDQKRAINEMYRVLRPGGRCFIAEPRYAIWASLPLLAMWLLAVLTGMNNGCREPGRATVLSSAAFKGLFASQPWRQVRTWQVGRYQYALCEKG
jgi:ubiquinone/menaquinone biosynthesis C-methylase UbiE